MPVKKYSKDRKTCQVSFVVPKELIAKSAAVCGDFNEWNLTSHPMRRGKDGAFKLAVKLPAGRTYRYRFLLDGDRWENDWQADGYQANPYGSEDTLLQL